MKVNIMPTNASIDKEINTKKNFHIILYLHCPVAKLTANLHIYFHQTTFECLPTKKHDIHALTASIWRKSIWYPGVTCGKTC